MIRFDASRSDMEVIAAIGKRARALARGHDVDYTDMTTILMDITACHVNGTPLRLEELLVAPDFDFAHDVFGIRRHIDRKTGALGGSFLPRYARI